MQLLNSKETKAIRRKKPDVSLKGWRYIYTPKHGSWLDVAEIEMNVMTRQCLFRRIAEIGLLCNELSAWEAERNTAAAKVNWYFRTSDARIKLSSLYPTFIIAS